MSAARLLTFIAIGLGLVAFLHLLPMFFGEGGRLMQPLVDAVLALVTVAFVAPSAVILVLQMKAKAR